MANLKQLAWAMLVVMGLVVVAPEAEATITCGQVTQSLLPCVDYLRSGGTVVISPACCGGVRALNSAAKATTDRQAVCRCLKQIASAVPSANFAVAASVPGKCGVNIPYKLDPSTDCSK